MTKPASNISTIFSFKNIFITTLFSIVYLCLSAWLIGYKIDQLVLVLIFNALYYRSHFTRKFVLGFSIFIVYWIIFDLMKAFPNYLFNAVHIESLYNAEKYFFGIINGEAILTPNEYWLRHTNHFLDVLTGMFYLCWVPVPLLFAAYLFLKNRPQFLQFSLTFLLVNLLGFVVYYIYPAAPPWYIKEHGFQLITNTHGNAAGLLRFDAVFKLSVFKTIYTKSSNVFAAMPSLHSAYPLIVLYFGIKSKLGKANYLFAIIVVGIWFAAVYNSHHYILDVVAGIAVAVAGIWLFQMLLTSSGKVQFFYSSYLRKIV